MDTPETSDFALDLKPVGGSVIVDGVDLTQQCVAVQVTASYREPTTLTLQLARPGVITGHGRIVVASNGDASPGDAIRRLDPNMVRALVIDAYGTGDMEQDMTAVHLDVIASLFDEDDGVDDA